MATMSQAAYEQHKREFQTWLAEHVGLTPAMLATLQESDDDWTFIIKIHAMIEVALNHMLIGKLNRPELNEIISGLNIPGKAGKVTMALALGLLTQHQANFISRMSFLRKRMVHDIQHFDFDLKLFLFGLKPDQLENWKNDLAPEWDKKGEWRNATLVITRHVIFDACMDIFSASYNARPTYLADAYRLFLMSQEDPKPDESSPKEQ